MKKIIAVLLVVLFLFTGCDKKGSEFKENYESLNNKENGFGSNYREVTIPEENNIVFSTAEDIIKMMDNEETFYVYFGDNKCPWCRSVIEKAIEVSLKKEVDKIYYVPIWDDKYNEILRDKYSVVDGELTKTVEGTDTYRELLNRFDFLLEDYRVKDEFDDDKEYETMEKRIYAPNFIYIENGHAERLTTGISDFQFDANDDLNEEILRQEEEKFDEFFQ